MLFRSRQIREKEKKLGIDSTHILDPKGGNKSANKPKPKPQSAPAPKPKGSTVKLKGESVYFGSNGGMLTQNTPVEYDPKTKNVSFNSKRFGGKITCQPDGRILVNGKYDPEHGCEFDNVNPKLASGAPKQVFISHYDYGKIAQRGGGGEMVEKVMVE